MPFVWLWLYCLYSEGKELRRGGMSVWWGSIEGEVAGGWDGRAQVRSTWTVERKDIWREVDTNIE